MTTIHPILKVIIDSAGPARALEAIASSIVNELPTCHASDINITVTHETNRCCCVEVEAGTLIY